MDWKRQQIQMVVTRSMVAVWFGVAASLWSAVPVATAATPAADKTAQGNATAPAGPHATTARSAAAAVEVPFSQALAVTLQPLQAAGGRDSWPVALAAVGQAYGRRQYAAACQRSLQLWQTRMAEGARLFYGPERRKADIDAIERFLDLNVRGARPLLAIAAEGFAPATVWRNLAVDACVRSGDGKTAVLFAAAAASEQTGAPRLALAVALALQAGRWAAAAGALEGAEDSVRVPLWRALIAPQQGLAARDRALKAAQTTADRDIIDAVSRHLGLP